VLIEMKLIEGHIFMDRSQAIPMRVVHYVPSSIPAHMAWCQWCAQQPDTHPEP
jgi:hypothetical protein